MLLARGKERLLEGNVRALHAGRSFAKDHLKPIGLQVRRADKVGDQIYYDAPDYASRVEARDHAAVVAMFDF